ncbi:hypothetical protein B0T14DRAFT_175391 [Immersiella caudata]|uniref:Uncharacterized protein n=1 Tax=Immersiella caudata TaxID=314043 RepID=A0AA39WY36_9PEZI|nr:hypothetical protein B0T14DRAFT_175391 [Immersiella caudata]
MPQLFANLTKNSTICSTHGGPLWADNVNKRLFLVGGQCGSPSTPLVTSTVSRTARGSQFPSAAKLTTMVDGSPTIPSWTGAGRARRARDFENTTWIRTTGPMGRDRIPSAGRRGPWCLSQWEMGACWYTLGRSGQ